MPVVNDVSLDINDEYVLRREGLKAGGNIRPEIKNVIRELIAVVENESLLQPAIAYEIFTGEEMDRRQSSLTHESSMHGRLLTSLIPNLKEIAVAVCTIGPMLEAQVTDYAQSGKTLRALLLDGIGSAAVDLLSVETGNIINGEVMSRGYRIGRPFNPGMPCLPLTEQGWLLDLVHAEDIGVNLTSSSVMIPRKSVSVVIGAGYNMQTWTLADTCATCSLNKTCPYKCTIAN